MVNFKDVANFYVGATVIVDMVEAPNAKCVMQQVNTVHDFIISDYGEQYRGIHRIKPILRRLKDITQEDAENILGDTVTIVLPKDNKEHNLVYMFKNKMYKVNFDLIAPENFIFLLSKGYDLFNLIDNHQAIDHATIK